MPAQASGLSVEILIPTARFVFSVADGVVDVVPEHRSPEAFAAYAQRRRETPVTGMLTFPNTVLVSGGPTFVVDPGLALQNEPLLKALAARGLRLCDLDFVALTHAHDDHAAALADLPASLPVVVHERETQTSYWLALAALLDGRELRLLCGAGGELAPGIDWALTEGHTPGGVSYRVTTIGGSFVLCGDVVGPQRRPFDEMAPQGPAAAELLASWRHLRAWLPATIIAGHLPPFAP